MWRGPARTFIQGALEISASRWCAREKSTNVAQSGGTSGLTGRYNSDRAHIEEDRGWMDGPYLVSIPQREEWGGGERVNKFLPFHRDKKCMHGLGPINYFKSS
jgi:hypothetical protein